MPVNSAKPILEDGRLMFAFAHDVRSYLRTILTRIQLVQNGSASTLPCEEQEFLKEAAKAAGDINGLLSAMLTLVSPDGEEGEAALRLVIQGSLIDMKPVLAAAEATLHVSNDLEVTVPNKLKRVIKELLTNACKFRAGDRPLQILLRTAPTADGKVEIEVSDNGLGLPAEYVDQMFSPFRRFHSRELPGHGLGLAICRRTLEDFGGTIVARAKPEGLSVTVRVPLGG